jgi:hypothetical protein
MHCPTRGQSYSQVVLVTNSNLSLILFTDRNNLIGRIPTSFGKLTALEVLDLGEFSKRINSHRVWQFERKNGRIAQWMSLLTILRANTNV